MMSEFDKVETKIRLQGQTPEQVAAAIVAAADGLVGARMGMVYDGYRYNRTARMVVTGKRPVTPEQQAERQAKKDAEAEAKARKKEQEADEKAKKAAEAKFAAIAAREKAKEQEKKQRAREAAHLARLLKEAGYDIKPAKTSTANPVKKER